MTNVTTIISGGQTGADQGGLFAGRALGLKTGGWAPLNFRTETGTNPALETLFGLRSTPSFYYPERTRRNVEDADGTVWFGVTTSPGYRCTARCAAQAGKPFFALSLTSERSPTPRQCEDFQTWIDRWEIETLNVAGHRESVAVGIGASVRSFLLEALAR